MLFRFVCFTSPVFYLAAGGEGGGRTGCTLPDVFSNISNGVLFSSVGGGGGENGVCVARRFFLIFSPTVFYLAAWGEGGGENVVCVARRVF